MIRKLFTFTISFLCLFAAKAQWVELGTGSGALNANYNIYSVAADKYGNVYTGGVFYNSDQYVYVAKWDGTQWTELGGASPSVTPNGEIVTISFDSKNNIYTAGDFEDGSSNRYVAKYDGNTWSDVGGTNPLNAQSFIEAVVVDSSGNVYAAGNFSFIQGSNVYTYVAKWDGTQWSELKSGSSALNANSSINALSLDAAGNIYAAGEFTDSNGKSYVAKWDGTAWTELGTGANALNANNEIWTIALDNFGNVYAAGYFTNANGKYYVAKWDGTTWSELGTGANALSANNAVTSIATDNKGNVYAAGNFTNSNGYYVAKWDGTKWSELGAGVGTLNANNSINSIAVDSMGNIYAGGSFTDNNGQHYVAKYSTSAGIVSPQCNFSINIQNYTNVSCKGNADGTITLNTTGGTAPYTYSIAGIPQSSNYITNLSPGKYIVTIKDATGCTDTISQVITQPAPLNVFVTADSSSCSSTSPDSILTAVVTGGTLPYSYSWSTIGGPTISTTTSIKSTPNTSMYNVAVTDINGCSTSTTIFFMPPGLIINTYQSNDTLYARPFGGQPPYTYSWQVTSDPPSSMPPTNAPVVSTKQYCIIDTGGNYTITVTDFNGCWTSSWKGYGGYTPVYNLTGNITNYDNTQNSIVYLLTQGNDSTTVVVLDSLVLSGGTFQFTNISDTSVFVYYVPDTASNPFSLPTYYTNTTGTVFINNANPITLNSPDTTIILASVTGADTGGTCSLSGTITSATSGQRMAASSFRVAATGSVSGIKLILVDSLGRPVQVATTNSSGNFYFHHLKNGHYSLLVDQPGFSNTNPPIVTVNGANTPKVQFELGTSSLQQSSGVTSIAGTTAISLNIYPNPNSGSFTITTPEAGQITVYNTLGEAVTTQAVQAGNNSILLEKAVTGVYTVIMTGQANSYTPIKIVKN